MVREGTITHLMAIFVYLFLWFPGEGIQSSGGPLMEPYVAWDWFGHKDTFPPGLIGEAEICILSIWEQA